MLYFADTALEHVGPWFASPRALPHTPISDMNLIPKEKEEPQYCVLYLEVLVLGEPTGWTVWFNIDVWQFLPTPPNHQIKNLTKSPN